VHATNLFRATNEKQKKTTPKHSRLYVMSRGSLVCLFLFLFHLFHRRGSDCRSRGNYYLFGTGRRRSGRRDGSEFGQRAVAVGQEGQDKLVDGNDHVDALFQAAPRLQRLESLAVLLAKLFGRRNGRGDPGVCQDVLGRESLLGVDAQQVPHQVLGAFRDVGPVGSGKSYSPFLICLYS